MSYWRWSAPIDPAIGLAPRIGLLIPARLTVWVAAVGAAPLVFPFALAIVVQGMMCLISARRSRILKYWPRIYWLSTAYRGPNVK